MLGVTRKIDELGRVVIPMEFRKSMGIEPGDPVEIFAENGRIILSFPASEKRCVSCGSEGYLYTLGKFVVCEDCLLQVEKIEKEEHHA